MWLCQRIRPGWFLPLCTISFGGVSLATALVQTRYYPWTV